MSCNFDSVVQNVFFVFFRPNNKVAQSGFGMGDWEKTGHERVY